MARMQDLDLYCCQLDQQAFQLIVWHFFLDLPLDEDEGEGSRIALLLGPHTLVAAVRKSGRVLVL